MVHAPFGHVPFVTTHLNWKFHHGLVRERQVVALAALAREWCAGADFPPIVVGDLNAEPDSSEIRYLCGLAVLETYVATGGSAHVFQCRLQDLPALLAGLVLAGEADPGVFGLDLPFTFGQAPKPEQQQAIRERAAALSRTKPDAAQRENWLRTIDARLLKTSMIAVKVLRRELSARGIGSLEIKKRGVDIDPAQFRTRLGLRGPGSATLVLTRLAGARVAILAERVTPSGHG